MWKLRIAALLVLLLWAAPASAQSIICPTAPIGTSDNRCASTQFVQQNAGSGITALTGDVTATGPGSAAATLATAQAAIHTWALTQSFIVAPVFTDQAGSRSALGLGSAATQNTGTAGSALPFLNGTNTWSGVQTFNANDLKLAGVTGSTQCLHADTTGVVTGTGVDCGAGGGGVSSVFGRTGAVVAAASDYNFNQLSGSVACAQMPALTGDIVSSSSSCATTMATSQSGAHTWAAAQTFSVAPVFADQSGSRTALGLGTAATQNTGTSGATLPFLNGTNTWSGVQTFNANDMKLGGVTGTSQCLHADASGVVTGIGSDCGAGNIPNASGSAQSTTGTASASSTALTLALAKDFANGQGIRINGAGPATTVGIPTSLVVTPTCVTTCVTTWQYKVVSLDAAGGVGTATALSQTTVGGAALTASVFNALTWTAPAGTVPSAYAVYRNIAGTYTLIGVVANNSFTDAGSNASYPNVYDWVPATAPAANTPQWLVTSVAAGGGTTSLTLGNATTSAVSGTGVNHDDTVALQAALTASAWVNIPPGRFNTTAALNVQTGGLVHGVFGSTLIVSELVNANVINAQSNSVIQGLKFQVGAQNVAINIPTKIYVTIRDIWCTGAQGSPTEQTTCINASSSNYVTVDNVFATGIDGGIPVGSPPRLYFSGTGSPSSASTINVSHLQVYNDSNAVLGGAAFTFFNVYSSSLYESVFNGFSTTNAGNAVGIQLNSGGQSMKFSGLELINWGWNVRSDINGGLTPLAVNITASLFDWCVHQCILLQNGANISITNNTFVGETLATNAGIQFSSSYTGGPNIIAGNNFNSFNGGGSAAIVMTTLTQTTFTNNQYINSNGPVSGNSGITPTTAVAGFTMTWPHASSTVAVRIASGAKALATTAIGSAACSAAQTAAATGTLTTDTIEATFNGDPTAVTGYIPLTSGMLTIISYPTADTVNFKVCNNTTSSITPGAITLNWRVVR